MVEVSIWLVLFLIVFGGYGLQAFFTDIKQSIKKKNWKFPLAIILFMIAYYFIWYGVYKCLELIG